MILFVVELCLLNSRISDYPYICQGKTRISGVNDSFEAEITDVSTKTRKLGERASKFFRN